MEALKLIQEQKTFSKATEINEYAQISEAELVKLFPLPRYFQIHFQHIHENIDELKTDTQNLREAVLEINTKLDLLIQLLTQTHY